MDTEANNNIDLNKLVPIFSDCKGTCKTPIGCTCGKMEEEEEEIEIFATAKPKLVESEIAEKKPVEVQKKKIDLSDQSSKQCTCGNNPGGTCGCKTGEGCNTKDNKKCSTCSKEGTSNCCSGKHKLEVYDWLGDLSETHTQSKMIEVQFKNTRKGYYLNSTDIDLYKGDIVAVEATPGHDIGEVTLTGKLVLLQMKKNHFRGDIKRVYRIAKPNDIEKQKEAQAKEHKTMLRAREIAEELDLNMKISDVEYQGDGNKTIFYYIADDRVDFRQLIKVYASEFRVKIEMKQIGARQEAGRVGGIGPCGRELCCSSSMSNFVSVSTYAARLQEIPLNPQKLAGQCGKLKCCLNFEADTYVEAQRKLPNRDIPLETKDATFFHFKTDVLSGVMTYSTDKHYPVNLVAISNDRAHEVIIMNKNGKRPGNLATEEQVVEEKPVSHDVLDNESITRFDSKGGANKKGKNKRNNNNRDNNSNRDNNRDNRREASNEAPREGKPRIVKTKDRVDNNPDKAVNSEQKVIRSLNREEKEANTNQGQNGGQEQSANKDNNQRRNNNRNNRNRNNRNRPPRDDNKGENRNENNKPQE